MSATEVRESLLAQAYREAMRVSPADGAALIRSVLTPRLATYVTGVQATKTVARWARGETANLRTENATRLRVAYEIVRLLQHARESPETIQAWFLGMNPVLDDVSPARALHDGNYKGVRAAACAFAAEG